MAASNNINTGEEEKPLEYNIDNSDSLDNLKLKKSRKSIIFSRLKRRVLKHTGLLRVGLLSVLLLTSGLIIFFLLQTARNTQMGFYAGLLGDFLFTPQEKISTIENRTNILILGKGGDGHEAPDLTDTIIFASFSHDDTSGTTLISLPRDIWIAALRTKLNSVYYWGNKKEENGGLVLAKSTVEEVVGQPVSYAVVVDFSGFKKIIDVLGEIEVDVEHAFIDNRYPITGRENDLCDGDPEYKCRYETINFEAGKLKMNGETALKFVRSRNAEGDEGTDLARAARQERVVEAIKNKVLSREILLSPKKLVELKNTTLESIETDITPSAGAILARKFFDARENLNSRVLSEELLENPPYLPRYDNLYVFIPKEEDTSHPSGRTWSEVHEWVECVLQGGDCKVGN